MALRYLSAVNVPDNRPFLPLIVLRIKLIVPSGWFGLPDLRRASEHGWRWRHGGGRLRREAPDGGGLASVLPAPGRAPLRWALIALGQESLLFTPEAGNLPA